MGLFDCDGNKICEYQYFQSGNKITYYDDYCCPRCYKTVDDDDIDQMRKAKMCRCKPRFEDGITKITKRNYNRNLKRVIDNLGWISKRLQKIDFAVTSEKRLKDNDLSIYIYAEKARPLGFIAIKTFKDTFLVTDFMVVEYKQRQGMGHKLFDFMLKDVNMSPEKLAFDSPSNATWEFLDKHYGMKEVLVLHGHY